MEKSLPTNILRDFILSDKEWIIDNSHLIKHGLSREQIWKEFLQKLEPALKKIPKGIPLDEVTVSLGIF